MMTDTNSFLMNHISQSVNKSLQTCGMSEIYKSFSSWTAWTLWCYNKVMLCFYVAIRVIEKVGGEIGWFLRVNYIEFPVSICRFQI